MKELFGGIVELFVAFMAELNRSVFADQTKMAFIGVEHEHICRHEWERSDLNNFYFVRTTSRQNVRLVNELLPFDA